MSIPTPGHGLDDNQRLVVRRLRRARRLRRLRMLTMVEVAAGTAATGMHAVSLDGDHT